MKRFILLVITALSALPLFAQTIPGAPAYQLPVTVTVQKWYGSGAPTSALAYPDQPGDLYFDTANNNVYYCAAPVTATISPNGLQNPACTSVSAGGWTLIPGVSSVNGTLSAAVCHATYNFAVDGGGAPGLITPAANCTIPANSIIYNEIIDWTTAGAGTSNTTSIGTTGTGGGAAILLGATAVASLTGIVQGVIVPQTASGWKKITTAGTVTLTTATASLTAGVAQIWVFYVVSPT